MTIHEQQQIVDDILDIMRRNGALKAPLGSGHADEGVEKTVNDLLDLYKDSGQFLTNVMKLPARPQMILLECVCGAGEYRFQDRRIDVVVKNISDSPVKIGNGTRHYRVKSASGEQTDLSHGERLHRTVKPGETLILPARRAAGVLQRHSKPAFDPIGQARWPHERDSIREIGYSYREQGTGDIVECPAKKSKK